MKWKTLLLLILALLLIGGSFVVPPVLLHSSVSRTVNQPVLTDASALRYRPTENIVEKLACFTDPEATAVSLDLPDGDAEALLTTLHKELRALYGAGAIPQVVFDSLYAAVEDEVEVKRFCMIQPEQHLMFELYTVCLRRIDAQLVLDVSSEKLLAVGYYLFDAGLLPLEYEQAQAELELRGWAEYLDLKPGKIERTALSLEELVLQGDPVDPEQPTVLKQMILTDEAGASVVFSQTFVLWDGHLESYNWGPIF